MMFPAQTSFIPITVALTRFIEANGFLGNYPFWYLGTTPVKYLTGPVVPGILIGLHKVLPQFSLFDLSLLLVFGCQLLMSIGWGMFAGYLSKRRIVGVLMGVLVFLLPWHWISGFGLGEVSVVLASALTPWAILAFAKSSKCKVQSVKFLIALAAFAILLLVNTTAAIPAVFGILILGFIQKEWQGGLKRALVVIFFGWVISLFWYGPGFWWTTFAAPSIGGAPAVFAVVNLVNLFRGFLPVILAVLVVRWGIRPKTDHSKFAFSWLLLFGGLTLFRFMADPDFWMDWVSWMGEVEVGLALLVAKNLQFTIYNFQSIFKFKFINSIKISNFKFQNSKFSILLTLFSIYLVFGWFLMWQNRRFWLPRVRIDDTVEYKIAKELMGIVKPNETVFLSGTTAFWLNSLVDVRQVRGGRDEASVAKRWREVAWELRNGVNGGDSARGLRELRVDYIVVHTDSSREFYHDFSNTYKFDGLFKKLSEREGDRIYRLSD